MCVCDIPDTTHIDVHYAVTYYTCHIRVFVVTSFIVLVQVTALCPLQSLTNRSVTSETSTRLSLYHASSLHCSALRCHVARLITHHSEGQFTSVFGAENVGRRFFPSINIPVFFHIILKTPSNTMQIKNLDTLPIRTAPEGN
jgi:hypothetical protein